MAGAEVEAGDYVEYVPDYEYAYMLELLVRREEEHTRLETSHAGVGPSGHGRPYVTRLSIGKRTLS